MCKTNELELKVEEYVNIQTGEKLDLSKLASLPDNTMLKVKPELWCEWNFEKNDELGIDIWKVTKGSHKKVWWHCVKCESAYDNSVSNKIKGNKCSYCSGRKVNHTNCLATTHSQLLLEWDFEKNSDTSPYDVTQGSHTIVYWKCLTCGSSYDTAIYNKTAGKGCSYCRGFKVNHTNSLASINPQLASQWHPTLNGDLSPHDVTCRNDKKAWWLGDCGHEWESRICNRSVGIGCPYCHGVKTMIEDSLATLNPELASQWHPIKNKAIKKESTSPNSNQKVWWIGECGHEWEAIVASRNSGTNCPYCACQKLLVGFNDMWTTNPQLASMLLNPEDGYKYNQWSKEKVNWKCVECHSILFNKRIQDVNRQGVCCIHCANGTSYSERLMSAILRYVEVEYLNNNKLEWSKNKRYDFYFKLKDKKYIIETHGMQHYDKGFVNLNARTVEQEQANDKYKYELAITNGILPENYIVIDCRYSDFEFIKNNILSSRLAEIFDLSNIDWNNIKRLTNSSIIKQACELWNSGLKTKEISEKIKMSRETVINYLKRGASIGLCDYNPQKEMLSNSVNMSKIVVGISESTRERIIYPSINQARKELGISFSRLVNIIQKKTIFNEMLWKIIE